MRIQFCTYIVFKYLKKQTQVELKEISLFLVFHRRCFMNIGPEALTVAPWCSIQRAWRSQSSCPSCRCHTCFRNCHSRTRVGKHRHGRCWTLRWKSENRYNICFYKSFGFVMNSSYAYLWSNQYIKSSFDHYFS